MARPAAGEVKDAELLRRVDRLVAKDIESLWGLCWLDAAAAGLAGEGDTDCRPIDSLVAWLSWCAEDDLPLRALVEMLHDGDYQSLRIDAPMKVSRGRIEALINAEAEDRIPDESDDEFAEWAAQCGLILASFRRAYEEWRPGWSIEVGPKDILPFRARWYEKRFHSVAEYGRCAFIDAVERAGSASSG